MASFTDSVRIVVDVVAGQAAKDLAGLATNVRNADTGFGKLRAGAKGLGATLSNNVGLSASAAGFALLGFATDAVAAFQDTALAAKRFGDATGLSTEQASRWAAVADDVGVSGEALQAVFAKMERTVGTNAQAFAEYGAEIVRTSTGALDSEATFLSVVAALQRIDDPARQAAAAQDLLGRSWQGAAEVIAQSAPALRAALASVDDAQVIDDEEVRQAEDYRAAIDRLQESFGNVALELGGRLVPALGDAADALAFVAEKAFEAQGALDDAGASLADAAERSGSSADVFRGLASKPIWQVAIDGVRDLGRNLGVLDEAAASAGPNLVGVASAAAMLNRQADRGGEMGPQLDEVDQAAAAAAKSVEDLAAAEADLFGARETLADSNRKATDALVEYAEAVRDTGVESRETEDAAIDYGKAVRNAAVAAGEARGNYLSAAEALDVQSDALFRTAETAKGPARAGILTYIGTLNGIPPAKITELLADADLDDVRQFQREIDNLRGKTVTVNVRAQLVGSVSNWDVINGRPGRAASPAGAAAGPGRAAASTSMAAGLPVPLIVNVGATVLPSSIAVGRAAARAIDTYRRRNGRL